MKNVEFNVPVKVAEGVEFTIKGNYSEPESFSEITPNEESLKIYNTGLRQIERNKVKSSHNFAPVAKKLFEIGLFPSIQDALNMILTKKGLK